MFVLYNLKQNASNDFENVNLFLLFSFLFLPQTQRMRTNVVACRTYRKSEIIWSTNDELFIYYIQVYRIHTRNVWVQIGIYENCQVLIRITHTPTHTVARVVLSMMGNYLCKCVVLVRVRVCPVCALYVWNVKLSFNFCLAIQSVYCAQFVANERQVEWNIYQSILNIVMRCKILMKFILFIDTEPIENQTFYRLLL